MRLVLHAGTHKTGTTSIQRALSAHRDRYREQGIYCPDGTQVLGEPAHYQFANKLVSAATQHISRAFLDFARETARPGETIVISAEPLYRHVDGHDAWTYDRLPDYWPRREAYLRRLAAITADFDVEVLLFFRSKDSFARSMSSELSRNWKWRRGVPAVMLEYERQVQLFRDHFAGVTILDYDQALANGGSVPAFFEALGGHALEADIERRERVTPHPLERLGRYLGLRR